MRFLICSGARVKVGADQAVAQEPRLRAMRARLQTAFRERLSYTQGDGLVTALLRELASLPLPSYAHASLSCRIVRNRER